MESKELAVFIKHENGRKKLQEFIEYMKNLGPCDKCGREVEPWNNAAVFDWINHLGSDWTSYFNVNRHLEPVAHEETGVIICPGSPSRWQNIGGLRDERPEYRWDSNSPDSQNDKFWGRAIWNYMQTLKPTFKPPKTKALQ